MSQSETPEVIQGKLGYESRDISEAKPEELEPHPANERIYGDTESAEQLEEQFVESVREKGVMEPLIVTEGKTIISGHRRQLAAIETGQETVPILYYDFDDDLAEREALIELNRQREKTAAQITNEFDEIIDIEKERGKERMSDGGRGGTTTTPSKSRDRAAEKINASVTGQTLERGKKVKDIAAGEEEAPEPVREVARQEWERMQKPATDGESQSITGAYKSVKEAEKQLEREQQEEEDRQQEREQRLSEFNQSHEKYQVLHGDFAEVDIEVESVDHILTDPPYGEDGLEAWEKLSAFADRVLKPGGFCIAYSGKYHLPAVMDRMSEHLEYYWQAVVIHSGPGAKFFARNLRTGYKPILIYAKPPVEAQQEWVTDVIEGGGREKDNHDWQQAEAEAADLLERFTGINDRICDPMAGSGTTLVACQRTDRRCVAVDRDPDAIESIQRRVDDGLR